MTPAVRGQLRTCGDSGGLGLSGKRCNHAAGFGTPHAGRGRCRKHDQVSDATMQCLKKAFIEHLEETSFRQACKAVNRDPATIWRWRKFDREFDAALCERRRLRDELNVAEVEDTLVRRCITGKSSAAETIFFLVNRGGGRWRHVQRVEHVGQADSPVQVRHQFDHLTLNEKIEMLRSIVARHSDEGDVKKQDPAMAPTAARPALR
jgi:hypothetical protein